MSRAPLHNSSLPATRAVWGAVVIALFVLAPADRAGAEPPEAVLGQFNSLRSALRRGEVDSANQQLDGILLESEHIRARDAQDWLLALRAGQATVGEAAEKAQFSRAAILFYGRLLAELLRAGIDIPYETQLNRVRQFARLRGSVDELYIPAVRRALEFNALLDDHPELLRMVVHHHFIVGSESKDPDRRRRAWEAACYLLPRFIERERANPSPNLTAHFAPLRLAARAAGQSGLLEAERLFEDLLARIGDGSRDDLDAFASWYSRVSAQLSPSTTELDPDEPWKPTGATRFLGYERDEARALRQWLWGLRLFNARETSPDRGSRSIARALTGRFQEFRPLVRIDLAESLRREANLLENRLLEHTVIVGTKRVAQLYRVAEAAILLRHDETLTAVVDQLSQYVSDPEIERLRNLVRAAPSFFDGAENPETEIIENALQGPWTILDEGRVRAWNEIARSKKLPFLDAANEGRQWFEIGRLWFTLGAADRLEGAIFQLRGHQAVPADRYYLDYLSALDRYRKADVEGLLELVQSLLDRPEPEGVQRAEIASLAEAVEVRSDDVREIRERRNRIEAEVVPAAHKELEHDSGERLVIDIVRWLAEFDRTDGASIDGTAGQEELGRLTAALSTGGIIGVELEAKWIELKDALLGLCRERSRRGDFEGANGALELARALMPRRPSYRLEQARILRGVAEVVPLANQNERRDAWEETGAAFFDASSSDYGDPELRFDAAIAYMEAENWTRARAILENYPADRTRGTTAEARFWEARRILCKLYRLLGDPRRSIELVEASRRLDAYAIRSHPELELEYARSLVADNKEEDALRAFERVLREQTESDSPVALEAIHGEALIRQHRTTRAQNGSRSRFENRLERSHKVWRELESKLPGDGSDLRYGQALHHLIHGWIYQKDWAQVIEATRDLESAATRALQSDLTPDDQVRWRDYLVRSAYARGDALFATGEWAAAARSFATAIELDEDSPLVAHGFLNRGIAFEKLGDRKQAYRTYQLGHQRVTSLPEEAFADLPTARGREFWLGLLARAQNEVEP